MPASSRVDSSNEIVWVSLLWMILAARYCHRGGFSGWSLQGSQAV